MRMAQSLRDVAEPDAQLLWFSTFANTPDKAVRQAMSFPLKSGVAYMAGYASLDFERRAIAADRWLNSMLVFLQYQQNIVTKKRNQASMKENLFNQLYAEIDRIFPSVEYCLASKKVSVPRGASA